MLYLLVILYPVAAALVITRITKFIKHNVLYHFHIYLIQPWKCDLINFMKSFACISFNLYRIIIFGIILGSKNEGS